MSDPVRVSVGVRAVSSNAPAPQKLEKKIQQEKAKEKLIVGLLKENEKLKLTNQIFKNKILDNENEALLRSIEEEAKNIMKKVEKIKERIKKGTSSKSRLDKITKHVPKMEKRHHNIDIRIENLEWDFSNIEKVVDKKCKYCDCKKINIIKLPNNHPHFAKEECSSCGKGQKFISEYEYPTYTV